MLTEVDKSICRLTDQVKFVERYRHFNITTSSKELIASDIKVLIDAFNKIRFLSGNDINHIVLDYEKNKSEECNLQKCMRLAIERVVWKV